VLEIKGYEVFRVDSLIKRFPVDPRMGSSAAFPLYPHFTPDAKALAYQIRANGVGNLWAQPVDGTSGYPLTSFKSDEVGEFHWSPSGQRLAIVRGHTESNVVLIREGESLTRGDCW
jgi:hypothetical protein